MKPVMDVIKKDYPNVSKENLGVGSTIFAVKPGDGSAREQAASCQKVLGGWQISPMSMRQRGTVPI